MPDAQTLKELSQRSKLSDVRSLVAFHEDVPTSDAEEIVLTENRQALRLLLWRAMSKQDRQWGWRFFIALSVTLVLLACAYIVVHRTGVGRIESMSDALVSASKQALSATQVPTATGGLTDTVASIRGSWNAISQTVSSLTPSQKQMFATLVADVEGALAKNDTATLAGRLQALNTLATTSFSSSGFWAHEPLRYVEVLLWGLAGILVNLIITTGNYLRWERFYREGLPMHLSQIVTMPLQALVFVLLLSQIALTVSVGGTSNLVLDLNNPRILVAVSFLIGSRPWAIWRFIQEAASKITKVGQ